MGFPDTRRGDDFGAPVNAQSEQVSVSGHQIIRFCSPCRLQNRVVLGVAADSLHTACHFDQQCLGEQPVEQDLEFDRIAVELPDKHSLNLRTNKVGNCDLVLREGVEQSSTRGSTKFERGDP
jgi:hypothetical protein